MMLTSVQLNEADYNFVKKEGLKFSELLREAIDTKRNNINGFIVENVIDERKKREAFQKRFQEALTFMENEGLIDKWIEKNGV